RRTTEALLHAVRNRCETCAALLDELFQFAQAEWGPPRPPVYQWAFEDAAASPAPALPALSMAEAPAMVRWAVADSARPRRGSDEARIYEVGASTITLRFGDIVSSQAEVLVSSDGSRLSFGGGVSAAILRAAGPQLREE